MLDFRVDTFLEVCKTMNYTKAAQALNVTQPAVSQHIRYLEESYGARLFDYKGKRLSLTQAGEALRDAAMTMKHDAMYLKEQISAMGGRRDRLQFGATLTIGEFVLPGHMARYLKLHPEAQINMIVANTEKLLQKLNDGAIDFALVEGFFDRSDYDGIPYGKERYIAVCAPEYERARHVRFLEELLPCPLILREPGSGTREILQRFLESRNLSLRDFDRVMEINNIHAIKSLVEAGCGVTFLYEAAAREELAAGTLREIPLEDFRLTHDFTFIWRKNSIFASAFQALFRALHT